MKRIYLDHAATTPLLPEVREAMLPWLESGYGNPSSLHEDGRKAKDAIDQARETISDALGCLFAEVLFTSSGTEAANLAILGAALNSTDTKRKRILLGAAEHHCVLHTQPMLEKLGFQVQLIPVDSESKLDLEAAESMLADDVLLVSAMHANNETGVIQPVEDVARLCRKQGALFHCDAVQTFLNLNLKPIDADLLTLSAHKVNGPKGVGSIYIRAGIKLQPLALGGGQEREMRAGTENVAGIAGFGAAVAKHIADPAILKSKEAARNAFLTNLKNHTQTIQKPQTLTGHAHLRFPGIDAETMLIKLDRMGISASSGAACSSGSLEASHVMLACGYSEREAKEGLRFTFGWPNTVEEAIEAAQRVNLCVSEIRSTRN
ncbi:MAG: cysteine desulfurase [Chlorobia bacterium]|nr:cysteine desulfurase [Fimbriimonadaceae bacterium]